MVPLSKIAYLLKISEEGEKLPFSVIDYVSDLIDILNYICKSQNHVGRVAQNTEIYKLLKTAIDKCKGNRHLVLHSAISLASALLNDNTKRNFEIAHDKWGCDMEGFLLLEKVRDKASKDTPTLLSKYGQTEIRESKIKQKLLKDMGVASLISEYFVELRADSLSMHTHESILTFLLDLAEEKEYRVYMVNKALFVYLNECFCNKDTSKRLKTQISTVLFALKASWLLLLEQLSILKF